MHLLSLLVAQLHHVTMIKILILVYGVLQVATVVCDYTENSGESV